MTADRTPKEHVNAPVKPRAFLHGF